MPISALRRLCVPFLVVAIAIALLALSSGNSKAGFVPGSPSFDPILDVKLCNDLPTDFKGPGVGDVDAGAEIAGGGGACAPDTAPGGHPDITIPFLVPRGDLAYDQSNFVSYGGISETRLAGPVHPSPTGGPNADGTGSPAGGLVSTISLGLAANPCDSPLSPQFIWWDAETDLNDTVGCAIEGTNDRWNNMVVDGTDAFPGQADATSPLVYGFPDCLLKIFDPDGSGAGPTVGTPDGSAYDPVQPHWRGAGLTQVAGNWQMLNNFEFAPGVLAAAFNANPNTTNHPFAKLTADLGFTNVIQLNDPTTIVLEPNPISDFCTNLGTKGMIKGVIDTNGATPGGLVNRITSPDTAGSYLAGARTQSYRDADGDAIENNFDTCTWTANTDDPYTDPGADYDMLDPACDPYPTTKVDDEDGDTYLNSQDSCPQVFNPPPTAPTPPGPGAGEKDSENQIPSIYNAANADGGPRQDFIGDGCDGTVSPENLGGLGNPTVSDGLYFNALYIDSVCIESGGTVDQDQDGWCVGDDVNDADTYNPAAAEDGGGANTCSDGLDNGAPGLGGTQPADGLVDRWDPDCNPNVKDTAGTFSLEMPQTSADVTNTDGDAITDWYEWQIGVDPLNDCPLILGHSAWTPDINGDRVINIVDLNKILPPPLGSWGATPGNGPYQVRRDLNPSATGGPDSLINIIDLNQILPPPLGSWGMTCTP